MSIIDEVKQITANQVAKKQDAAKLNFPKIIEKIKAAAALGESSITLSTYEVNQFDQKLLQDEGFRVMLITKPRHPYDSSIKPYDLIGDNTKVWQIQW